VADSGGTKTPAAAAAAVEETYSNDENYLSIGKA